MERADRLRERARRYRERADAEPHSPIIQEAFYQIANALEGRAALSEAAEHPIEGLPKRGGCV